MLKKLKIIWKNRKQIFQGIKNTFFKHEDIERIALDRLSICKSCTNFDDKGYYCLMPGTQPCCGICGCKLAFKTRSLSSECPHPDGAKWKSYMTQEEEDKYYKEINYNPDQE